MNRFFSMTILAALLFLAAWQVRIPGPGGKSAASAPSFVVANVNDINTGTPVTGSISGTTVNVGDKLHIFMFAEGGAALTFTPTLTGSCAATGGFQAGTPNPGYISTSAESGYFSITTGCSNLGVSVAYTGGSAFAAVAITLVRGSSVGQVFASAMSTQSVASGTNNVNSNSVSPTSTATCVADTTDLQDNLGTLTAGTNLAWTLGTTPSSRPTGTEYLNSVPAGATTADFSYNHSGFMITGEACYE